MDENIQEATPEVTEAPAEVTETEAMPETEATVQINEETSETATVDVVA